MEQFIITTVTFRASGYSDEERAFLKKTFATFGPTRLRAKSLPEAGGSGELSIWIQIGVALGLGAIEAFGGDLYHRISSSIMKFINSKYENSRIPVEVETITLSFDNLDIIIRNPSDRIIESIGLIVQQAHQGIATGGMKNENVTEINIGYGGPIEVRNDDMRYWSIYADGSYTPIGNYDAENDVLLSELLNQEPKDTNNY